MAHFVAVGRLALLLLCVLTSPLCAAPWIASVDQDEGLPTISIGGAVAASAKFVFWRKDWAWSGLATSFKVLAPFDYEVSGKNQGLNFDLNARITKPSDRQL